MILNELIVNSKITTYVDINRTVVAKKFSSSSRISNNNGQISLAKVEVSQDGSKNLTTSSREVLAVIGIKNMNDLLGYSTKMYLDNNISIEVNVALGPTGLINLTLWENNNPMVLEEYMERRGTYDIDNYYVSFDFNRLTIEIVNQSEVEVLDIKDLEPYHNGKVFVDEPEMDAAVYEYLFEGARPEAIEKALRKQVPNLKNVFDYLETLNLLGQDEKNCGIYYQIPVNYVLTKYENSEEYKNLAVILRRIISLGTVTKLESINKNVGRNLVYYGVPGSGKSYAIRSNYMLRESNHLTVTFHPEYSYYDFVGNISPVLRGTSLAYEFVAGPFTRMLKKAVDDVRSHYYLIIEEINRANASSVFGDLFQLLDRNPEGESEYSIYHKDIARYVYGDENHKVALPKNFSIIATMNTSDQNVFTLDTAFKRRFDFKYVKITQEEFAKNNFKVFVAKYNDEVKDISWPKFATSFNDYLLTRISEELYASEDKQLGPWFLKDIKDETSIFVEKVLRYIWDDVVKHERSLVFNQRKFDEVLESFDSDVVSIEKVFNPEFARLLWM